MLEFVFIIWVEAYYRSGIVIRNNANRFASYVVGMYLQTHSTCRYLYVVCPHDVRMWVYVDMHMKLNTYSYVYFSLRMRTNGSKHFEVHARYWEPNIKPLQQFIGLSGNWNSFRSMRTDFCLHRLPFFLSRG